MTEDTSQDKFNEYLKALRAVGEYLRENPYLIDGAIEGLQMIRCENASKKKEN